MLLAKLLPLLPFLLLLLLLETSLPLIPASLIPCILLTIARLTILVPVEAVLELDSPILGPALLAALFMLRKTNGTGDYLRYRRLRGE